ncbi:sigma factor-like helix-turn-helix DNA-binding protein, partial [Piscibacillus halophilus]|uniref:sigma factor-like helix-turn-helix DNA-binding protein n=1 Tax=Piscibacillus halophilus TaxID=571933 RepID=UPI001C377033
VTILWMLGVRFSNKLAKLVKLSEEYPTTFIQINSDLETQLSDELNSYIADKFMNVGIEKVPDLNMIPVESIEWLLGNQYKEFKEKMLESLPVKELSMPEESSDDPSKGSDEKTISLENNLLTIPADLADVELKIDQFENCQNVVRKLNAVGIYRINELPNKLDGFHTKLKHVGPKAIEKFWEGLVLLVNGDVEEVELKKASDEFQGEKAAFEHEELTFCESMKHQLIDSDAGYFNSMPIVLKKFKEVGIYYYKDLPYNLSKVQEIKGVGLNKVKQLFQILKEINQKYIEKEKFEEEIKGLDDQQLIHFFLNKAKEEITQVLNSQNKQKQLSLHQLSLKIFEERFKGFQSGESVTLQNLGDKYGVTRERIRQIASKTLSKLESLEPRWVERIVEQAKNKQALKNEYFNLDEFVDFVLVKILENHEVHYKPEFDFFMIHSDTEFNELKKQASRELNREFKGRLTTKSEIDRFLVDFASRHQLGKELVQLLFKGHFIHVEALDGYILSNTNKHDAAQIVLSKYPDGLDVYKDIDRIAEELNKVIPGEFKADRSTSTLFLTSKECYLWGRGRYIHKKYVNFDAPILDDILNKTEEIVNERGILSVNRLYKDHEEQLKAFSIPNEYALYTLLRTKESEELSFIKFPKIYPAGSDRKENSEIIKDYIRKLGNPIPVKDLKKHFMKELGWKKFTIEFAISNDYEIFSCDWGIITVAELDPAVNQDKLKTIHDKIARNLKDQDVVHINKFYVDYESLCRSMNIDNALYLYNALRYYFHGDLLYFRYPYITEFGREFDEMTNVKLIESYVLEEMAEVSREEVADWVINELGGNDGTVHNVLSSSNNLLTYTRGKFGELIHRDVIGWNDEKEKQLIQVIQDYTEQFKDDIDKPFINLDKALDDIERQLPELDNDVLWTSDLIADILKRSTQHSFLIIGSSDKIVINQSLFNQIASHTQFIEYMLLKHFNGSAKLSDFRNMLHDIGYSSKGILHEVEIDIKEGQTPLTIVGNEIVYNESKVKS